MTTGRRWTVSPVMKTALSLGIGGELFRWVLDREAAGV